MSFEGRCNIRTFLDSPRIIIYKSSAYLQGGCVTKLLIIVFGCFLSFSLMAINLESVSWKITVSKMYLDYIVKSKNEFMSQDELLNNEHLLPKMENPELCVVLGKVMQMFDDGYEKSLNDNTIIKEVKTMILQTHLDFSGISMFCGKNSVVREFLDGRTPGTMQPSLGILEYGDRASFYQAIPLLSEKLEKLIKLLE